MHVPSVLPSRMHSHAPSASHWTEKAAPSHWRSPWWHGVQAATAMGKLRSAMGALGLVVESVPELISRLDQFAEKIEEARFGTVAAVQLQPETGELRYSLAAAARDRP